MKVSGLRSMVLDDIGAREGPVSEEARTPLVGSLGGTERLDERVAEWLRERARFARRPSNRIAEDAESPAVPPVS